MLGLGLDIKKDQGFIAGAATGELSFVSAADTDTSGIGLADFPDDENIGAFLRSTDTYTKNKLTNNGSISLNGLVPGSFSVTLQRVTGSTGSESVAAQSTGTMYGYIVSITTNSVQFILSTDNTYSGTSAIGDAISGTLAGMDATSFGGTDISSSEDARYRIKFTYTVGSQTSAEFTTPSTDIDAA